jgi:hypothetical protein
MPVRAQQPPPRPRPVVERRAQERPEPRTSGRCGFCGSQDTYAVAPESFHEWALERWGDAALMRCHDCGRRQAISGLQASSGDGEWALRRGVLKVAGWTFMVGGAAVLLLMLLRQVEQGPASPARIRVPAEKPASPSAPAPSPSSGPFSLRSTPTNAA